MGGRAVSQSAAEPGAVQSTVQSGGRERTASPVAWEHSLATLSDRGWQRRDVIDGLVRLLRSPGFHWGMSTPEMERALRRRLDDAAASSLLGIARTWLLGADAERDELVHRVRGLDGA